MEVKSFGFIQEAFKGFLNCLGLEVVNNSQSPLAPQDSTTYETLPAADDKSITDPLLLHIFSSSDQTGNIPVPTTRGFDNNVGDENNLTVVIDEIINMSGGQIDEAHYVDLLDDGKTNMNLLATRLISSGGGGKTH